MQGQHLELPLSQVKESLYEGLQAHPCGEETRVSRCATAALTPFTSTSHQSSHSGNETGLHHRLPPTMHPAGHTQPRADMIL